MQKGIQMRYNKPKQASTLPCKTWLILTCLLGLNLSCAQVTTHDEEFWGVNGIGATGVHTLTKDITHVDEQTWLSMSIGMICETAGTFADVKTAFEQLCSMAGPECTVEVQQQATMMFDNVARAHGGPLSPNLSLPLVKAVMAAKKLKLQREGKQ
jgi:hypothetical protein